MVMVSTKIRKQDIGISEDVKLETMGNFIKSLPTSWCSSTAILEDCIYLLHRTSLSGKQAKLRDKAMESIRGILRLRGYYRKSKKSGFLFKW